MTLDERRGHLRYLPPKKVWVTHCDTGSLLGQVVNISESGLLLLGQHRLNPSDQVSIILTETKIATSSSNENEVCSEQFSSKHSDNSAVRSSQSIQVQPLISSLPLKMNVECLWVDQSSSSMAWSGVQFINLSPTQIIGVAQILAISDLSPS